jgi:serine/threonine-protein kinase HipA
VAEIRCLAEVRLWGRTVGALAEDDEGRVVFEYDRDFRLAGLEISPIHLPLTLTAPVRFDELRRQPSFNGVPGVFADSLPDDFGNRVIRAYYAARGRDELAMSPVQRLLYVGERAIGALTYHPAERLPIRPAEQESLEVATLVRDARKVVEGQPDVAIPEIYRISASAGGKRPKALVRYTPDTGAIRSGYATPQPGDVPCVLKFDGVGDAEHRTELIAPLPFNRVEAAYAAMARDAGIDMAEVSLLESEGGFAHLLVRRFDVVEGRRLHQHTLGGLLHLDYNDVGASSYEEYLRTCIRLGLPPAEIEEAYRRMLLNVVVVNQDDHVKNLSFHLHPDGHWSLTPAYDVTFARGAGFTSRHQMRVADKRAGITARDLLEVGERFGIKGPNRLLAQVIETVRRWPDYAAKTDVAKDARERIARELEGRRAELG